MCNEKWEAVQSLKNELFATKNETDFNETVKKIGDVINGDPTFTELYKQKQRDYINNLREKKKTYWAKYGNKPAYAKKEVYLLREETEKKLQNLLDLITKKYERELASN